MATAPLPVRHTRELPAWLELRPLWTAVTIVAMWTAVVVDAIVGPDIVTVNGGSTSTVPSAVVVALFAAIATIFVAWFGRERP